MNASETLFDKAKENYESAAILYHHLTGDEAKLNIVGYLLQQALELALQFVLEMNGVEYLKTHDIEQLLCTAKENNVETFASEYLKDHGEMFSAWESKTRYILGYRIEKDRIERGLKEVEQYLETISKEFTQD